MVPLKGEEAEGFNCPEMLKWAESYRLAAQQVTYLLEVKVNALSGKNLLSYRSYFMMETVQTSQNVTTKQPCVSFCDIVWLCTKLISKNGNKYAEIFLLM